MANLNRTRKRVHAIRRASNGSAFEKCDNCGLLVAISLADMHECKAETQKNVKRYKGISGGKQVTVAQSSNVQPKSPFRFFMEVFLKTHMTGNPIDIDRIGFETWKNMSKKERQPYIMKAAEVNSAYIRCLNQEVDDRSEVDDEADSAMVGKVDWFYEYSGYSNNSEIFGSLCFRGTDYLYSWSGIADNSC